jgi:hypothetical protein
LAKIRQTRSRGKTAKTCRTTKRERAPRPKNSTGYSPKCKRTGVREKKTRQEKLDNSGERSKSKRIPRV